MNHFEILETQRLWLRAFQETDWQPLCDFFRDEECVRYTIKTPLEDWQTWRMLACYIGHWTIRGYGPYAVVEKNGGELVGAVGLWFPGDWPEPELKWALRRRFWGKGYATEAAAAVRDMAQKTLKWSRLISLILPRNRPSVNVAKRLGGKFEKTIPFRGGTADIFAYDLAYDSKDEAEKTNCD
jgi:RimJ/RimL family protein N-acetyltransferase